MNTSHGLLPVPAPATTEIIARRSIPVAAPGRADQDVRAELLTPTGAAIIGSLATPITSTIAPTAVGYGFGTMQLPWPNALRLILAESADTSGPGEDDRELQLETNIDDMNPQAFELLNERLYAAGAYEVWLTPVLMKKSRPGTVLSLIAPARLRGELERVILENSTSLGVRSSVIDRTKAGRSFETAATRFGDVTLKLKILDGRVLSVMPEYDDCVRLARESDALFAEVWDEAHRIGERFVGARVR